MENKDLLSVQDLSIAFPQGKGFKRVVEHINFNIQTGEIIGLVGESGSGKSLSALAIMGLLPKNASLQGGQIYFQTVDQDLSQLKNKALESIRGQKIGMIFQEPMSSLNPVLKCGHQIEETILIHQKISATEAKALSLEWMERVGLKDLSRIYQSYPHQLSGGQKQRIMIAMAMCCNPDLLIADEPTTALDVTVQKKILELLLQLRKDLGTSILLISHDLAVVGEIADRVIVMQAGKVVEIESTKTIFKTPSHPYTQGLLACKPVLGKNYHRLPTIQSFLENQQKEASDKLTPPLQPIAEVDYSQTPVLIAEDLNVFYAAKRSWWKSDAAFQAVKNVSFEIYPGETLGLVGESGCGKSTLGKAIAQLKDYTGTIQFDQQNYQTLAADRNFYRLVQIIFQDPYSALNPRLPIGEAITEPMRVHKIGENEAERKVKTIDLLKRVGLEEADYIKYPHQFSGGQRQRISIARALSVQPRFIICDEVVSALDVSVQAQVLNLLKDLQAEQDLTYLFISHDLAIVQFMSDRIAVMEAGRIVELAKTEDIYSKPQSTYTQILIDAIPGQKLAF